MDRFVTRHGPGASNGRLVMSRALQDFMALARETGVALPADMALLLKALITADQVLLQLDPQFDVVQTATPWSRPSCCSATPCAAWRASAAPPWRNGWTWPTTRRTPCGW